jgi:hypothetical protein
MRIVPGDRHAQRCEPARAGHLGLFDVVEVGEQLVGFSLERRAVL